MFDIFIELLGRKRRAPPVQDAALQKRKDCSAGYLAKLSELRDGITEKNVRQKAPEFYALIKTAFRESLSLTYEATFQEIAAEIERNNNYSAKTRDDVTDFLSDVAMMEYGYEEFRQIVEEKKHEKERLLHDYIMEMEKEGDHLRKDTKRKIADIVSESIPHTDREFLVRMVDRFRSMLRHIF